MDVILFLIIYLLVINLTGFVLMGIDKHKAKKQAFRIPETTLFIVAAIGGSIGSILGMYTFRHKTRHFTFVYGMPAILVVQILLLFIIIRILPIQFSFL